MTTLARTTFFASLAVWIGGAAFFTLVVLPVLFTRLPPSEAGGIAALLFPFYYRVGAACSLVLLAAAGYLALRFGGIWRAVVVLTALMSLAQAYSAFFVQPRMAALRGSEQGMVEFQALHVRAVRLNGFVLASGLVLVFASGYLLDRR